MGFTSPATLALLLLLPVFLALGWPRRGAGRGREILSLALRLAIALCLILALAGLEVLRAADELAVVFLLDGSDSMPRPAQEAAEAYIRSALDHSGPDDQAAVVVFGADALVERGMASGRQLPSITSAPRRDGTDLGEAIRLGLALYPPGTARRMVILSDGMDTSDGAEAAARLASASGVQILAVPYIVVRENEALIAGVDAPVRLHPGERFSLDLQVIATDPTPAEVRVLAGGQVVYRGQHDLDAGEQSFSLPLSAGEPGFTRYEVQIEPQIDGQQANNKLAAYSLVEGPPRLLVAAPPPGETLPGEGDPRPDEAGPLVQALEAAGLQVDLIPSSRLPSDLGEMAPYSGLVLVDVPARQLSRRQMETLQSYVRDLGGGLVAVGGPTSFGVGGYFRTPLEETLPVSMEITDETRRPSLAMVFVIDRSGSMAEVSGGAQKLELAKEAAIRSVELLAPSDRVGVVAFDEAAGWAVPLTDLADPAGVQRAIASLRPGGGTDILAGLQAVASALPQDPASLKHVILLTDGGADPTGLPELAERLYREENITLTTVGVGRDAAPFLPELARLGGGRFHFTAEPAAIPTIFTEETVLATRAYLVEHPFTPAIAAPSPILTGLETMPPLLGYVAASPKETAQTLLVSDLGDPILAVWQVGLGRAAAFTSDASGRWAREWLSWEGFPAFWGQIVAYTLRPGANPAISARVEEAGETARLVVDARSEAGESLNGLRLQASVVTPLGERQRLALEQVAPGRYSAPFEPGGQGAYLIQIQGTPSEEGTSIEPSALNAVAGWVRSYSPEYRDLDSDPLALARLAARTGGIVASGDPAEAFLHNLPAGRTSNPAWPVLLTLAALLLPLDIAVRRLGYSVGELRQILTGVREHAARLKGAPAGGTGPEATQLEPRLETLRRAKERASTRSKPAPSAPIRPKSDINRGSAGGEQPPPDSPPAEKQEESEKPGTSTAASLLAAKRQKRKKP